MENADENIVKELVKVDFHIHSVASIKDKNKVKFNNLSDKQYSILSSINKIISEEDFSNKNIIIFTFWTGNMCKNNITNCSIIDGTLNFDVIESYKEDDYFYTLESYLWLVILEVDKLETLGINNLSINYKKGTGCGEINDGEIMSFTETDNNYLIESNCLSKIIKIDKIPKTPTGKIMRKSLWLK